jgi:hypothetical protein
MNEAQSIVSLFFQAVIGVAAAVAAYYGYKNHNVGQSNATKLVAVQNSVAAVQESTNGTQHILAANLADSQQKNENLLRSIAAGNASTVTPPL